MKATRDWFGESLAAISRDHDNVVVVNCDLASATKTSEFKKIFPERFLECGIAEANAVGVAAGLAQEGFRPFIASFGHFLTGKYLEIFQSVGLNNSPVVLVGTHAGLAIGKDGPTQMGLRDLALMRTLQNVEILHPADGVETRAMLAYLARTRRPAYLRLCRQPLPEVHGEDYTFVPGRPDVVHRGADVVLFTMGGMVQVLLEALPELARDGIDPTVVNISSLPVDAEAVRQLSTAHGQAFVVEDHFVIGGIADEVGRCLLGADHPPRFGAWGVGDYGQAGSPEELYARYSLDAAGVADLIRTFVSGRRPQPA